MEIKTATSVMSTTIGHVISEGEVFTIKEEFVPTDKKTILICKKIIPGQIHLGNKKEPKVIEMNLEKFSVEEVDVIFSGYTITTPTKLPSFKEQTKKKFKRDIENAAQQLSIKEMEDVFKEFRFKELLE